MIQDDGIARPRFSTRLESPLANDPINGGNIEINHNSEFLHKSPSTNTSLSGNDYVEVTANGELRSLSKRVNNSSNSLDKQAGLKCALSADPAPVPEETVHHYDNLLAVQEQGSGGDAGGGKGRAGLSEKSGASEYMSSEFLDFFDNMESMEKKEGSLASLM